MMTVMTFTVQIEVDEDQPLDKDQADKILAELEEVLAKRNLDLYHSEYAHDG
jgi:hypothetical protein